MSSASMVTMADVLVTSSTTTSILTNSTFAFTNNEEAEYFWPEYFGWPTVYSFWLIFGPLTLMGIVGNVLVMVAVLTCRKMRKSAMNVLMTNLALADAGNLVMSTPDWMLILINRAPAFTLPPIMCTVCRYAAMVCLYVSLLTQVAICAERYVATLHPLHVHVMCSRVKIHVCIVCIWAFSALFAMPTLQCDVLVFESTSERMPKCTLPSAPSLYLKLAELNIFYLLPLVLLIVLYFRIAKLLWATPKFLLGEPPRKDTTINKDERVTMSSINSIPSVVRSFRNTIRSRTRTMDNQSLMRDYEKRLSVRRRVVVMLVVCVSIYFICYSPIQILFLSSFFGHGHRLSFVQVLTLNALCYANSACNPVVYTVFSERFRARILHVVGVCVPFGGRRYEEKLSGETRRLTIVRQAGPKSREARLSASLWRASSRRHWSVGKVERMGVSARNGRSKCFLSPSQSRTIVY